MFELEIREVKSPRGHAYKYHEPSHEDTVKIAKAVRETPDEVSYVAIKQCLVEPLLTDDEIRKMPGVDALFLAGEITKDFFLIPRAVNASAAPS